MDDLKAALSNKDPGNNLLKYAFRESETVYKNHVIEALKSGASQNDILPHDNWFYINMKTTGGKIIILKNEIPMDIVM